MTSEREQPVMMRHTWFKLLGICLSPAGMLAASIGDVESTVQCRAHAHATLHHVFLPLPGTVLASCACHHCTVLHSCAATMQLCTCASL